MLYKFAENDGSVVVEEYDKRTRPTQEEVKEILIAAFNANGKTITFEDVEGMDEVYKISYSIGATQKQIYISIKPTTPGGRGTELADEQRILQLPKYFNYVADRKDEGMEAVSLGVYRRNNGVVFCAWKVAHSTAGPENRVSKQVKIDTIARAMQVGFAQQRRTDTEYVCVFRKEFLYFYLENYDWLHGAPIETMDDHVDIPDVPATDTTATYSTGLTSPFPRNRILFGAPGTGKSYMLNKEKDTLLASGGECERVTFHPDYSYANFVGTYKPVPSKDEAGNDIITYSYVPGPFMRTYVKALKNGNTYTPKPYLLIIEEINRANVAAVFGDVFQLLDRNENEFSEYPIEASEDIRKFLSDELGGTMLDHTKICIPDNMFIWATMNSADQGVFPMDTAFKRRWDFTYLGIDDSEAGIIGKKVFLGQGTYRRCVEWNSLRKAINSVLLTYKVNEDKLMGPYFISKKNIPDEEYFDSAAFSRIFKNKVIMYLFDDAAKQKHGSLFAGCDDSAKNQYSKICQEFDTKGVYIFCDAISSQFIESVPEGDNT